MNEDENHEPPNESNPCSKPSNKSSGVTQQQLSKFQELQRRRLHLTSKPKNKKFKSEHYRGSTFTVGKSQRVELDMKVCMSDDSDQGSMDHSLSSSSAPHDGNVTSPLLVQDGMHPALQKKKLHWGLDTKERWERKANM